MLANQEFIQAVRNLALAPLEFYCGEQRGYFIKN